MRNELFKLSLGLFLGLTALLLFFSPVSSPLCQGSPVSAQDNPCAEQEATIVALEEELANAQATIAALEAQNEDDASKAGSLARSLFEDSFEDNSTGWNIFSQPNGRASLQDGQLAIQANACEIMWLTIPEFQVPPNFYAEVRVTPGETEGAGHTVYTGFGVGVAQTGQYHTFSIVHDRLPQLDSFVVFQDQTQEDPYFATQYEDDLLQPERGTVIGLEAVDGVFTFYVNGEARDAYPIELYGRDFGLWVFSGAEYTCLNASTFTARFDDLEIREAR